MNGRELLSAELYSMQSQITFPCKVCGDKSSGVHYGVMSCEGCKGFYRRTIRQKMKYPSCVFVGNCRLTRETRTRCQECRFKKCIEAGMSKECIKYGRIPKKEKAKIIAERIATMQNSPTSSNENLYSEDGGTFQTSTSRKHKARSESEPLSEKYFRMSPVEQRRHSISEGGRPQNTTLFTGKLDSYLYDKIQRNDNISQSEDMKIPTIQYSPTIMPQRLSPIRIPQTGASISPLIGQLPLVCTATVPLATTLSYHYSTLLFNQLLNAGGENPLRTFLRNQALQSSLYASRNHDDKLNEDGVIDLTIKK